MNNPSLNFDQSTPDLDQSPPGFQLATESSIEVELQILIRSLKINPDALCDWLSTKEGVPERLLARFIQQALFYELNPVEEQFCIEQNTDGQWEIYIPINGWMVLLHRQPCFAGIEFKAEATPDHLIPGWMECTIHRSDLSYPITIREYWSEVNTDHLAWVKMPRRMLRHKTMEEAIRMAFGIFAPRQVIVHQAGIPKINPNPSTQATPESYTPKEYLRAALLKNDERLAHQKAKLSQ